MSNLSPAAIALEADLRLLTKLPRQMSADLNDIKERVFGSKDGVPRTEEQSRWRYVDAIVKAFNASGATSIDDFAHHIGLLRRAVSDAQKDRDTFINERDEALRERDEKHKDLVIVRRRLIDVEAEGNHLRTENANLKDSAHALTTERDSLAARVREHEETLAVLSNVNADLFKAQQELREAREESKRWHANNESLEERLQNLRDHVRELQAETVEQESRYNHLALVVVDLLKGRGVE